MASFNVNVNRQRPAQYRTTEQIDPTTAQSIEFFGAHALAAKTGYEQARIEGNERQEVPTKEVPVEGPDVQVFAAERGDVGGNLAIEVESDTGSGSFSVPENQPGDIFGDVGEDTTRRVFDPDVDMSFHQIRKARQQGVITAEEAEIRVNSMTASAINRMPGIAGTFRQQAADFFGTYGPGSRALQKTFEEKQAEQFAALQAKRNFEDGWLAQWSGRSINQIREMRALNEVATLTKDIYAADLTQTTGSIQVQSRAALELILANANKTISESGGVMSPQDLSTFQNALLAAQNTALADLESKPGYQLAAFGAKKAARDNVLAIFNSYSTMLNNKDAAKVLPATLEVMRTQDQLAFALDQSVLFSLVNRYGKEGASAISESLARNRPVFEKALVGDTDQIRKTNMRLIEAQYESGDVFAMEAFRFFKDNNMHGLGSLNDSLREQVDKSLRNHTVNTATNPYSKATVDAIGTMLNSSTIEPASDAAKDSVATMLDFAQKDYRALVNFDTANARPKVLGNLGEFGQLVNLVTDRIATNYKLLQEHMAVQSRSAESTAMGSDAGAISGITDLGAPTPSNLRQQMVQDTNLTNRLLIRYPEIWNKKYATSEEFIQAIMDQADARENSDEQDVGAEPSSEELSEIIDATAG